MSFICVFIAFSLIVESEKCVISSSIIRVDCVFLEIINSFFDSFALLRSRREENDRGKSYRIEIRRNIQRVQS